jgi:hypothetical protein
MEERGVANVGIIGWEDREALIAIDSNDRIGLHRILNNDVKYKCGLLNHQYLMDYAAARWKFAIIMQMVVHYKDPKRVDPEYAFDMYIEDTYIGKFSVISVLRNLFEDHSIRPGPRVVEGYYSLVDIFKSCAWLRDDQRPHIREMYQLCVPFVDNNKPLIGFIRAVKQVSRIIAPPGVDVYLQRFLLKRKQIRMNTDLLKKTRKDE